MPDLSLLMRAHVQKGDLGRKNISDPVFIKEFQTAIGQRALIDPLRKRMDLSVIEQRLQIFLIRALSQRLHERGFSREEITHDADVEISGHKSRQSSVFSRQEEGNTFFLTTDDLSRIKPALRGQRVFCVLGGQSGRSSPRCSRRYAFLDSPPFQSAHKTPPEGFWDWRHRLRRGF